MLQNIRKTTQGPVTKVVVWLIVISFAIFGIESILLGGGGGGVAEVNGEDISPQELQQAVNNQKRRLIAMMGDNIDPAMLDDELLGARALDTLINRKLLMQSADDMGLAVSKREVGSTIAKMEQFQIEGKFSPQLFTSVLSNAGFTPAYFKQSLRDDITINQLRAGLMGSEFSTPLELGLNAQINAEQRDLQYLTIPLEMFLPEEAVSEEDIQDYYAANQDNFMSRETLQLDYIELNPDDFRAPVDEADIEEAYQLQIANAQYRTENRVSHILFERGDDETQESLQQRIAAAQAALAAGTAFAEVAGEFSDDIGSAATGGDLGFSSGDAFPPEMEEAIAQLEPDVVSDPVTTDAGVHLILVTERREGHPPSLEELRPQLEEQIQLSAARAELLRTVEELKDLAFNADDLAGPAQELDLEVKRSEPITREQADGLFANPSLLSAAFSEDVLQSGHNSEVIEIGGDNFVVLRVRKHNLPERLELSAVHDQIAAILRDNAARAGVASAAQLVVQSLRGGAAMEQVATDAGYAWHTELAAGRRNTTVPPEVLTRAFEMPAPSGDEPVIDVVMTSAGDARVVALTRVEQGDWEALQPAEQVALRRELSTEFANLLDNEYQSGLHRSADISVR